MDPAATNDREKVRPWIQRATPARSGAAPARLYVAESCVACSRVGRWVARRNPVGLVLTAAEDHPRRDLTRITYDPGDGSPEEEGVAAFARALQHMHPGWAVLGWAMHLPGPRHLIQRIVDAAGGGPRLIPRRRKTD